MRLHPAHEPCDWDQHQFSSEMWVDRGVRDSSQRTADLESADVVYLSRHRFSLWCVRYRAVTSDRLKDPNALLRRQGAARAAKSHKTIHRAFTGPQTQSAVAKAAHHPVMIAKALLQGAQRARLTQALDSANRLAFRIEREQHARRGRLTIDEHGARAAVATIAHQLGAGERRIQMHAQSVEQTRARLDGERARCSVDAQREAQAALANATLWRGRILHRFSRFGRLGERACRCGGTQSDERSAAQKRAPRE